MDANLGNRFKVLLIYPNCMLMNLIPSSIASLSAYLKSYNIDVELFDTTFYRTEDESFDQKKMQLLQVKPFTMDVKIKTEEQMYKNLYSMVNVYKPDLIGISLVEDTIPLGLKLLDKIKAYDCPVIAGGVGATFNSLELIWDENIDAVCIGEGEEVLLEVCRKVKRDGSLYKDWIGRNIKGLTYKRDDVILNGVVREPIDINKLPYLDFDIFGEDRLKRPMHGTIRKMIHVEVDRGCPYKCSYCAATKLKNLYSNCSKNYLRKKSNRRIIEELKYLKDKHSPDYIDINSETFLTRPVDAHRNLMEDFRREIALPFWCQSRPETFIKSKVEALKLGGCTDAQMGIEHGNEEFRKVYLHRSMSNKQILKACALLEEQELPYSVNNIIGWPDETRELVFDTIELNRKINPKTHNCYMMTPYKGSWIYDYCIQEGLLEEGSKTHQALTGSDIRYRYMTKEKFLGLQRCFSLYAKMPDEFTSAITVAEKFDKLGDETFEKLSKEFIRRFYEKNTK